MFSWLHIGISAFSFSVEHLSCYGICVFLALTQCPASDRLCLDGDRYWCFTQYDIVKLLSEAANGGFLVTASVVLCDFFSVIFMITTSGACPYVALGGRGTG